MICTLANPHSNGEARTRVSVVVVVQPGSSQFKLCPAYTEGLARHLHCNVQCALWSRTLAKSYL